MQSGMEGTGSVQHLQVDTSGDECRAKAPTGRWGYSGLHLCQHAWVGPTVHCPCFDPVASKSR